MAASTIENVVAGLKDIIDKNGPSYLTEEPYEVFRELIDSGTTDRKTAAGILHLLASGIMSSIDFPYDPERISEDKALAQQLQKNPFMTKEAIHDLFTKRLHEYLDHKFEYYCTCEDYYQPVVEDFGSNLEYDLPKWCKENGFEYVSFEGDGEDDGYEPKFRNNWY